MNYFYIFLLILFVGLGYYAVNYYIKKYNKKSKDFIENNEFKNTKKKLGDVYFFYTTWCPHSRTSMKVWDNLVSKYKDDNFKLNFIKVDCDKETDIASEYNIKEYPSIIMEINKKRFVYDTNLEETTFIKFSNAVYESL